MILAVVSLSEFDIDANGKLSSGDELGDTDADAKLLLSDDAFHPPQRAKENRNSQKTIIYNAYHATAASTYSLAFCFTCSIRSSSPCDFS